MTTISERGYRIAELAEMEAGFSRMFQSGK